MNKYRKCKKNISANADGPRDVASCKIDHIAVHAECNHPGNKRCVLYLKHIATDGHLSIVSTYIHGKAQTPLGRFVVDILYSAAPSEYL